MVNIITDTYDVLTFEKHKINIMIDKENNMWFSAIQIIKLLEYKNVSNIIKNNISEKNKIKSNEIFINEAGLYELVSKSDKKNALEFKMWLYEELLPNINKYIDKIMVDKYKKKIKQIKKEINEIEKELEKNPQTGGKNMLLKKKYMKYKLKYFKTKINK